MRVLALVGMGPRGAGLLERLVSNAAVLDPGPVEIHLVDPHPVGGGRVWRSAQSGLLRLNSTAEDVTAFLDDSVQCEGPITTGPTLYEWARAAGGHDPGAADVGTAGSGGTVLSDVGLMAEAAALGPLDFASRRLASAYFGWAHEQVVRRAPVEVNLVTHRSRAVDLTEEPGGGQRLILEDGTEVFADAVVLLSSHVDTEPAEPFARLARFAVAHDLAYLPPAYGGDVDLSCIRAGRDTIVRGFGLGFVDLMILLTQGRGGRFLESPEGLSYLPSGREPRLHVGSRRGVPYHCKPTYHLRAAKPSTTKFLTPEAVSALLRDHKVLGFRADVWPLVAKEIAWAYYFELGLGHQGRIAVSWDEFAQGYASLTWGTPDYDAFLAQVVPDPVDRLDLTGLDQPLWTAVEDSVARCRAADAAAEDGAAQASAAEEPRAVGTVAHDAGAREHGATWADRVRGYVRADLDRRLDDHYSADLGAFHGFLAVLPVLGPLLVSPKLTPASLMGEFWGWWMGLLNFYASGPPPERLEQLLALERAGVLSFLGPDLQVRADVFLGVFVASTPARAEPLVAAQMIDATLPAVVLPQVTDPLLRSLYERGEVASKVLRGTDGTSLDTGLLDVDGQHRVVDATGQAHGRRFSLGMHTTVRPAAFARPGSNGPVHRLNDQVARTLLRLTPMSERLSPERGSSERVPSERATADRAVA